MLGGAALLAKVLDRNGRIGIFANERLPNCVSPVQVCHLEAKISIPRHAEAAPLAPGSVNSDLADLQSTGTRIY